MACWRFFLVHLLPPLCLLTSASAEPAHRIELLYNLSEGDQGSLTLPTDVELFKSRAYVVDSGNHRIVAFDRQGKALFSFGKQGSADGELQAPVGLGIDPQGRVYVADRGNHRIQIFTPDGEFLASLNVVSDGQPVTPIDVAVNPATSNIIVTGNNNHEVMVLNRLGRLVREWGGNGAELGKFRYPATVAMTRDAIAVVDVFNTRVQLFQPDGAFLVKVGEWGVLPGQLFRPKGVAVDNQGLIVVSDSYLNVLQVFNDAGKFQYQLKQQGEGQPILTPAGIAVSADNRLFVAEMLNHRVSVFQIH